MATTDLTQSALLEYLSYDPESGFFKFVKKHRKEFPGNADKNGYLVIRIGNCTYFMHRLAWLYMYGEHPADCLDHRNRVKHDNRILNLREATRSQNNKNTSLVARNQSGYKGVSIRKDTGKWRAQCRVNGKNFALGDYKTAEDAYKVYVKFAQEKHGEFFHG